MRSDDLYLVDIVEAAEDITNSLRNTMPEQFALDRVTRNAVLWSLMVISEAATKLSEPTRSAFRDTDWSQIRGFRNRLVHGYFSLDWRIVWQIASEQVPALTAEGQRVLQERFPLTYAQFRTRGSH